MLKNCLLLWWEKGFPDGSAVKNLPLRAAAARDAGSIPGSERSPGGGHASPPVFLPGESHGQRSLGGYSPWGRGA